MADAVELRLNFLSTVGTRTYRSDAEGVVVSNHNNGGQVFSSDSGQTALERDTDTSLSTICLYLLEAIFYFIFALFIIIYLSPFH